MKKSRWRIANGLTFFFCFAIFFLRNTASREVCFSIGGCDSEASVSSLVNLEHPRGLFFCYNNYIVLACVVNTTGDFYNRFYRSY